MSAELNLILFKAKPDTGKIVDFDIVFMSASSEALYSIAGNAKHRTLLKNLPGKKQHLETYIQLIENGKDASTEILQEEKGKMIRTTLQAQGRQIVESWEYVHDGIKSNGNHDGTLEANQHFLKLLLNSVPQGIYITKPLRDGDGEINDLEIVTTNKYLQDGETLLDIYPELKLHMKSLSDVFQTGDPHDFVVPHIINDKVTRLNISCSRADGQLIITEQDINQKKEYDKKINELNKELVSKNRDLKYLNSELRTFNSIAAHDYKDSLKKMYTALEFIITHDATKLSNEGKANLRRVQSGIQRMKLLTEDIISFGGLLEVTEEKVTLNPGDIIGQVKGVMSGRIDDGDLTIEYTDLTPIPGYPTLLYLLFYHLVENAIKFREPARKIHIRIECTRVNGLYINHADASPDTFYDLISISDNGIGFDQESAGKIFAMFYRIDKTNRYKGSGTGLAYCRKIMQMHDGFITARGTPGEGAVFTCYFPCPEDTTENNDT